MAIANWTCVSWVAYASGTIAVNVIWIEREFNACQSIAMYPSTFNCFPVIQTVKSKVRNFSTFFAHFGLPCVRPWAYRGKCQMDRKRIQCLSNASLHVAYPSIFNHFWDIAIYRWRVTGFWQFSWANERFYHILLSPGYAPGTIAVNVIRLERGFNACKTPRCIYPSIFNRFWDIASYWSKIAIFLHPTSV